MQQTQRNTIDIDTRREIVAQALRRNNNEINRLSQVDFVARAVMAKYRLSLRQVQGTALGREIDRLGEELRRKMLTASLKQANS